MYIQIQALPLPSKSPICVHAPSLHDTTVPKCIKKKVVVRGKFMSALLL